jgi:hypothetical protein
MLCSRICFFVWRLTSGRLSCVDDSNVLALVSLLLLKLDSHALSRLCQLYRFIWFLSTLLLAPFMLFVLVGDLRAVCTFKVVVLVSELIVLNLLLLLAHFLQRALLRLTFAEGLLAKFLERGDSFLVMADVRRRLYISWIVIASAKIETDLFPLLALFSRCIWFDLLLNKDGRTLPFDLADKLMLCQPLQPLRADRQYLLLWHSLMERMLLCEHSSNVLVGEAGSDGGNNAPEEPPVWVPALILLGRWKVLSQLNIGGDQRPHILDSEVWAVVVHLYHLYLIGGEAFLLLGDDALKEREARVLALRKPDVD